MSPKNFFDFPLWFLERCPFKMRQISKKFILAPCLKNTCTCFSFSFPGAVWWDVMMGLEGSEEATTVEPNPNVDPNTHNRLSIVACMIR